MAEVVPLGKLVNKEDLQALLGNLASLMGSHLRLWIVDARGETILTYPEGLESQSFGQALRLLQSQAPLVVTAAQVAAPILADQMLVGALIGASAQPDKPLLPGAVETLSKALSIVIGNELEKRALAQELVQRYAEINWLYSIGETIGGCLDLEEVVRLVLQESDRIIGADKRAVVLWDESGKRPVVKSSYGFEKGEEALVLRATERVLYSGEPEIAEDRPLDAESRITCLICVPLKAKSSILGSIALANKKSGKAFTASDAKLLTAVARQAATAIENARLYSVADQELTSRLGELYIMQEIDRQLNATLDSRQVLGLSLEWALRSTEAAAGLIAIIDEEQGSRVLSYRGYPIDLGKHTLQSEWFESGIVSRVLRTGEPALVPDVAGNADYVVIAPGMRSQLVVPLCRQRKPVGVMCLESPLPNAFNERDLEFIVRVADHATVALENARLYENVRQANDAKSEFVSTVAHELKVPMTGIKGFINLMRRGTAGPIGEKQLQYLEIIEANVNHMDTLIGDLLDISHLEAGVMQMTMQPVAISKIAAGVLQSLEDQIKARHQRLTCRIPDTLPLAFGDADRISQVLTNLVSNACKYTPEGGEIEITVQEAKVPEMPDKPGCLIVSVRDTGIGISESDQKRLFAKFFRADHPLVRETDGTGLGLSIVKRIVELHGGNIWVRSAPDQGSIFSFSIPIAGSEEAKDGLTSN